MTINKINYIYLFVLMLTACTSATENTFNALVNTSYKKDKTLQISISKLPFKADTSSLSYRIRLTPITQDAFAQSAKLKEKLLYNMDSCFYLYADGRVIYPQACETINGGIPNTFEYLVSYGMQPTINNKKIEFNYHDKYINQQKYTLPLN